MGAGTLLGRILHDHWRVVNLGWSVWGDLYRGSLLDVGVEMLVMGGQC